MKNSFLLAALLGLTLFLGCRNDDDTGLDPIVITNLQIIPNPSGVAPLTALLRLNTNTSASVRLRIEGRNGAASDIVRDFPGFGTSFELPVLGLYPAYDNPVEITFLDSDGNMVNSEMVTITTDPLIADMPQVRIDTPQEGASSPVFNFVNYFGHNSEVRPQRAFLFDQFGDIRWYLNYAGHPVLGSLFYDNGMNLLANGNLIFGDGSTRALYEIDRFGEIRNTWSLRGYGFHHHVIEKPNGNFLVTVNDPGKSTVEDVIIELDRGTGDIVRTWDLNESLDNSRRAWPTELANLDVDWFHANGLAYSASDDAIIVSGRTQGVVKLSADNEVIWILAPHRGWAAAGNNADLTTFLLQPLDAQGLPIDDAVVRNGTANHPDFEWSWYQHSPILLPNGELMVFDNGDNRNYVPTGFSGGNAYSRAVAYSIDAANQTVRQVWSYGKARGPETFSRIVSKVSYSAEADHVLFTPGSVAFNGANYGKVIEIDRLDGRVVFEATVTPPIAVFNITFHNVQRMPLYAD